VFFFQTKELCIAGYGQGGSELKAQNLRHGGAEHSVRVPNKRNETMDMFKSIAALGFVVLTMIVLVLSSQTARGDVLTGKVTGLNDSTRYVFGEQPFVTDVTLDWWGTGSDEATVYGIPGNTEVTSVDVTRVNHITGPLSFTEGTVGPLYDFNSAKNDDRIGDFAVLHNVNTGHYGAVRVDDVYPGKAEMLLDFTWWFQTDGTLNFSEAEPSITVISPNGGEVWQEGETHRIVWEAIGINGLRIYIEDPTIFGSGSTNYIVPDNNALPAVIGYYDWTIPPLRQLPGGGSTTYRIRIDAVGGSGITDVSDAYFAIPEPATIALLALGVVVMTRRPRPQR